MINNNNNNNNIMLTLYVPHARHDTRLSKFTTHGKASDVWVDKLHRWRDDTLARKRLRLSDSRHATTTDRKIIEKKKQRK